VGGGWAQVAERAVRLRLRTYCSCRVPPQRDALNLHFCVLLDARRPDLLEHWYRVMRCIRSTTLRTRCKVLTWQELVPSLPSALRKFLQVKYGIAGNAADF